jgi:5-methylcytosine-specific restriction endonuclease McrA
MKTYQEKLKDPRWQKKRLEILQVCNFSCEDCGCRDKELQIHHCFYIKGMEPWEYDISLLMCLCPEHHVQRQKVQDAIYVSLAKIMRFLKPAQAEAEAWNIIEALSVRETARLAEAFS